MNNFSPNMLKTFTECPRKYELKYVKQITMPQKISTFEKGKKIHALANYYLRGDDISKLEKTLDKNELYTWEILKSNEYFQKTCIKSEYYLSCKINDFWIGGRLDALVQDENHFYILDYKTGSIPENPEYDWQTAVYLLAINKFLKDTNAVFFIYIDLKNNLNYKIPLTKELELKYMEGITNICTKINRTNEFARNEKNVNFVNTEKSAI